MRTQFDNLKENEIDSDEEYYCSQYTKSSGFNLVVMTKLYYY